MKAIITLTHILFPVLIGLIIGGAVSGDGALVGWGLALIALDIIVGIALQYMFDKSRRDAWNKLSPEEKNHDKSHPSRDRARCERREFKRKSWNERGKHNIGK